MRRPCWPAWQPLPCPAAASSASCTAPRRLACCRLAPRPGTGPRRPGQASLDAGSWTPSCSRGQWSTWAWRRAQRWPSATWRPCPPGRSAAPCSCAAWPPRRRGPPHVAGRAAACAACQALPPRQQQACAGRLRRRPRTISASAGSAWRAGLCLAQAAGRALSGHSRAAQQQAADELPGCAGPDRRGAAAARLAAGRRGGGGGRRARRAAGCASAGPARQPACQPASLNASRGPAEPERDAACGRHRHWRLADRSASCAVIRAAGMQLPHRSAGCRTWSSSLQDARSQCRPPCQLLRIVLTWAPCAAAGPAAPVDPMAELYSLGAPAPQPAAPQGVPASGLGAPPPACAPTGQPLQQAAACCQTQTALAA